MNAKRLSILVVLVAFSAYTAYIIFGFGYTSFLYATLKSHPGTIVLVDLAIACSLIIFWMHQDGKQHKIKAFPYIIITILLGSVGPLLYLLRREFVKVKPNNLDA